MYPENLSDYLRLGKNYDLIPMFTRIESFHHSPIEVFERLHDLKPQYILESAGAHADENPYTYIGFKQDKSSSFNQVDDLDSYHQNLKVYHHPDLPPFYGGYIGYLAYEHAYKTNNITSQKTTLANDFSAFISDLVIAIDRRTHALMIIFNGRATEEDYVIGQNKINNIIKALSQSRSPKLVEPLDKHLCLKSNMTKASYKEKVTIAKEYIQKGDIFQLVLSQQFTAPLEIEAIDIYKSLRLKNPAPYLSYIDFGHIKTLCSSPECLIRTQDTKVFTAPIAGTRAIKNDGRDHLRTEELIKNPKEIAEHLMLVDLGRNDLNKICLAGSVEVSSYCKVKKYEKVMHLVSAVEGKLEDNISSLQALHSAFPAGTVSGAPKKRAMEIIDLLEPSSRGLYAGSLFYLSHKGDLNSCIAIRTIIIRDKTLTLQCGGGIVYDSNSVDEFKEIKNKAQGLLEALKPFYKGGVVYDFSN